MDDRPPADWRAEWAACQIDPAYFVDNHCHVYDGPARGWLPFRLWPAQWPVLDTLDRERLVAVLKARQVGLSWLVLAYALWLMTFWPAATVLVFSRREEEAVYLLGEERLRGMWRRLPAWLRVGAGRPDGATAWALANGSVVRAFPSNAGDSYTATLALVDEADLVPDLDTLLGKVKPTVDAGGKLVLVSRSDKARPDSPFKALYRAARDGAGPWKSLFLPWHAHPGRDAAWREAQRADVLARTGRLDELNEQYPATDEEALSARTAGAEWPADYFPDSMWFDGWPTDLVVRAIGLDPSKSKDSKSGDYSAFVLGGRCRDGLLWLDADLRRRTAEQVAHDAVEHVRVFKPDVIGVEANQFQQLFSVLIAAEARRQHVFMPLVQLHNTAPKPVRIRRLGPYLGRHEVRVKNTPGGRLLAAQWRSFPEGDHDDGPDAAEMCLRAMIDHWNGRQQRQRAGRATT